MNNTPAIPQVELPVVGSSGANLIREAAAVMADAHSLASAVASTQMIPKHFQGKPDECAAAMLYGASLGLDPMQSVRQIYVVHGQAALYARAMSALVQGAGHKVWTVESTDQSVTVSGSRRGSEHVETSTWTFQRAQTAGYTNNAKYKTDPQAMLYSKALSEVCRKIAPDVLSGVYSVEEMEMEGRTAAAAAPKIAASDFMKRPPARPETPAEPVEYAQTDPEPEGITSGQQKKMGALMREVGITQREHALAYVSDTIGREVASRSELTKAEAGRVIEALEADAAQDTPTDNDPDAGAPWGEGGEQ